MNGGQSPLTLKKVTADFVRHKKVLLKVDYNVPLKTDAGRTTVADDSRIKITLPTLQFLIKNQAKIIITSHLGRPKGEVVAKYRTKPVAQHLATLLKKPVVSVAVPAGPQAEKAVSQLQPGEVLMLENSRFDPGERTNDPAFAKQLARLADVYVNDGFASAHRAHASVAGVTRYLPAAAGFALIDEVTQLSTIMHQPARPFVAVIGGAKISDKVEAIANLSQVADVVLVGGGVANNFLKADGLEVYRSYLEDAPADEKKEGVSFVSVAQHLIHNTKTEKMMLYGYIPLPKIIYPSDVIAADDSQHPKEKKVINLANGNNHEKNRQWMFLDIGPKTIQLYQDILKQAKTIFWNGPMGVFEQPLFAKGTQAIAKAVATSRAKTVIGGGDTLRAIHAFKLDRHFDVVSAAGGAALEFLGGKMLPGIKPLLKKP
ncbi:MAG: Phosphoglycerate kinase [Candidatus Pacebacteria bacterium GW2011_GWB1_47_8]|nr:MAG: Phosphoglycerate kinase [Candidatus Pacebacteria bacterium GW2011_GWA1_46_10]KKU84312.1 MAG: Phosphoglycerate kinase [Candidatus Pacebacteria bacterium GW2011_GWB1_47_8]HCR81262.1 phosphoglycerate kinase [Candidatus Paceibacterota bacterium]